MKSGGQCWGAAGECLLLSLLCLAAAVPTAAGAPNLTRGPYLQQGTPSSVKVCWRTSEASISFVRYGVEATNLLQVIPGGNLVSNHVVSITNLQPATRYFYEIGTSNGWFAGGGTNQYFITSPPVGTTQPTRLWVLGDSGEPGVDARMVRDAYAAYNGARPTDLWLMLGDNAYDGGKDSEYQAGVFNMYPAMLRNTVLWPTIGNHDKDPAYFSIFNLPPQGEAGGIASGTESYYSFDYANIHFVCLDSYRANRTTNGPMYAWLRADLEAATAEWLIAFWHHPPYTFGTHDSDDEVELVEMREVFVPLLESYGVDLVLNGHSHTYERSYFLNGHYGNSSTFHPSMIKSPGSGREDGDGPYRKPAGLSGGGGTVYTVAGCGAMASDPDPHPAMFFGLGEVGSLVIDINGNRLDLAFLTGFGTNADYFTILKAPLATNTPATPTNLMALGVAADRIELSWIDTASDESSFKLERSTNATDFVQIAVLAANATQTIDTGLAADTTYYYRLRAHNVLGDSDYCEPTSATTLPPPPDLTPPGAVNDLATLLILSNSITLRWTAPGDDGAIGAATQYDLRMSTEPMDEMSWSSAVPVPNAPTPQPAGQINSMIVEGLSAGIAYWFALKTADETNNISPLSNVATGTTLLPGLPTSPAGLAVSAVASNLVSLRWIDQADNEASFRIERSIGGQSFAEVGAAEANATNYSDSSVGPEMTYFYRVKAVNAVGDSPPSNVAQATTPPVALLDFTAPAAVTDLRLGPITTNSVVLLWTAPGDDGNVGTATHYQLRRRSSTITEANWATATPITNLPVPLPAGLTQTVTVPGLQPETTYYFALKTVDETNNLSPLSNVRNVTTPEVTDPLPPAAVTNLRITALALDRVSLAWTAPGDDGNNGTAYRYDVRYHLQPITEGNWDSASAASGEPLPAPAGTVENFTVTGLAAIRTYYFALQSRDAAGNLSPLSNLATGTTPAPFATNIALLILSNSVWKYLNDGTDQGRAWTALDFDDTAWASGAAQLGYGNPTRDVTVVGFGPDPDQKPITTYFRRTFTISDPSLFEAFRVSVVRDDGAVVYLNGSEVFRDNLPAGPINYLTVASSGVSGANKTSFHPSPVLSSALLQTGSNIVAVEVHQRSASSSQLAFNLELSAPLARPFIQIALNSSGEVSLQWKAHPGRTYRVQRAAAPIGGSWTNLGDAIRAAGPVASATDLVNRDTGGYYRVLLLD